MKMFKSSVRGFKKSDVNNYIIEMHREFSGIKDEYDIRISGLKEELKKTSEELEISKARAEQLAEYEKKCACLEAALAEALAKTQALVVENTEYGEKLRDTEDALSTLADRVVELEEANSALKAELSNAERNAAHSLDADVSHQNTDAASEKVQQVEAILTHMTANTVRDLNSAIHESADSFISDLRDYAERLLFTSKSAADGLAGEYGKMAEKVFYYFEDLEKNTAHSISEFKNKSEALCGYLNNKSDIGEA